MSDDPTLPPVPNTPRNLLRRAWGWMQANPHVALPAVAFVVGLVIGKWVL